MAYQPLTTSIRSRPKRPDSTTSGVCRASSDARHRNSSREWRRPCGRRPSSMTMFDITALLHPGTVFDHPRDVVANPSLSISEKRAILASWASDASAIASCPALRAPAGLKAPVTIDEIINALCELDGGPGHPPGG